MVQRLMLLGFAGAMGTLARYGMGSFFQRVGGMSLPTGTLAVNVFGSFLAGLLWALFDERWQASAETKLLLLIGFMGAFTTFSAFILETGQLAKASQWAHAFANIMVQNGLGFAALFVGVTAGKFI